MNNMEVGGEEKRVKRNRSIYLLDRWQSAMILSYIEEDGLISIENLFKSYFSSFLRVLEQFESKSRRSDLNSYQVCRKSNRKSCRNLRCLSEDVCWNSRLGSELPTAEHLLEGITSSSGPRIRRSIYVF